MTHRMIVHDAKEFAGVFYDQNRSAKFRATWPNQDQYVLQCWPHFVEHVRKAYAEMLTRNDVTQAMKDQIYAALIADAPGASQADADAPLQLAPNTQQFHGDAHENKVIEDAWTKAAVKGPKGPLLPIAKRLLKGSTSLH